MVLISNLGVQGEFAAETVEPAQQPPKEVKDGKNNKDKDKDKEKTQPKPAPLPKDDQA